MKKVEKMTEKESELPFYKEKTGLKFNCPKCGKPIIVKFLEPGEVAKYRNCAAEVPVPTDAEKVNFEGFQE